MTIPFWPAMMKQKTAAAYCELSVAEFEREVNAGRLPMPVKLGNSDHWYRASIDDRLGRMMSDGRGDWRATSGLYNAA